ncbi:MAG: cupredoxin domain-containing protein [Gammaproteobacteria bacterium]|nr:cupredoxin domain-containing protein [Gammaproteobacteria bacterium]
MGQIQIVGRLLMIILACAPAYLPAADEATVPVAAAPVAAELGTDGVQRVEMILDSYSFSPSHVIVEAGKPVELNLKNVSSVAPHSLVIDDPAAGFTVNQSVSAGKSATLQFTPPQPGQFAFFCDKKLPLLPSHRKKGMEGMLEVR